MHLALDAVFLCVHAWRLRSGVGNALGDRDIAYVWHVRTDQIITFLLATSTPVGPRCRLSHAPPSPRHVKSEAHSKFTQSRHGVLNTSLSSPTHKLFSLSPTPTSQPSYCHPPSSRKITTIPTETCSFVLTQQSKLQLAHSPPANKHRDHAAESRYQLRRALRP